MFCDEINAATLADVIYRNTLTFVERINIYTVTAYDFKTGYCTLIPRQFKQTCAEDIFIREMRNLVVFYAIRDIKRFIIVINKITYV